MTIPDAICQKRFATACGSISYWVLGNPDDKRPWLVFLPGLTADHRLFAPQLDHFASQANVLVWDPPSHGESRPFDLRWTLEDVARWLRGILEVEAVRRPVLVGQSMGGYVAQAFMRLYPGAAAGFVSIDSCPLGRSYYARWELCCLRHTKLLYLLFPWRLLRWLGATGCATSSRGRQIMAKMMNGYTKREYCELAAHGYRALEEAVQENGDWEVNCPAVLLCGTKDSAGSAKRYNRAWQRRAGHELVWVEGAGHNSNTDDPATVNGIIEEFVDALG